TSNYVPKFIAAALIAGEPEKYGFSQLDYELPMEWDEVTTTKPLTLQTLAKLSGATVGQIKELNPALLRNVTPPGEKGYSVRVPSGSAEAFNLAYQARYDSAGVKVTTYTVKKGETLAAIAKRHHVRVNQIMEANDMKSPQLRVGQQLTIVQDASVEEVKAAPKPASKSSSQPSKTKAR
ncbi:MAG TPA: LysM peptidoglycan-binding domain-containing protein, partial [Candidatus Binatia bacterium]